MRRIDAHSRWSWRLAVTAAGVAAAAAAVALLGRLTGGGRTFAPVPALAIPIVVAVAMAGLLLATSTLRGATRLIASDSPTPEVSSVDSDHPNEGQGPLWEAWRRAVRAVMLSGALVLGAPIVLLLAYASV